MSVIQLSRQTFRLPAAFSGQLISCRWKGHAKWQNIMHIKKANDARVAQIKYKYYNKIQVI